MVCGHGRADRRHRSGGRGDPLCLDPVAGGRESPLYHRGGHPEDYGWCEGVKFPDGSGGGSGTLHSREDIPWEEFIQDPDWYGAGLSQVEELFEG